MNTKRVLLMYITEVSGHHQATLAIEKSLKVVDPHLPIMNINGFGYTYPKIEKIVNKAYMGIIKKTPKIWDYLYDNPKVAKSIQSLREAVYKSSHAKFRKLLNQFKPDIVVCTQAFPCGMVADYKKTYHLPIKVVGVLTDYAPHSYWIHEGVDYYVVPSEDTGDILAKKGVEKNRIKPFGIPVDQKFTKKLDKTLIFKKLGLDSRLPVVLIMGGGQGLGPIKDAVKSLLDVKTNFQLIVVAGINKKLIKWLKKMQNQSSKNLVVLEYVNNIEELMEVATLIVTKPGGMTTAEALTKNLPMAVIKPIPGQEMHNTDFLLKKGVAIRVNRLEAVGADIALLLEDSQRLLRMRRAAEENSKPNSSSDIAKLILQ